MYTIGSLIYGIPIDKGLSKAYQEYDETGDEDGFFLEDSFKVLYHGSSTHEVGYLGVLLKEFNAIQDPMLLSSFTSKAVVTDKQKEEVKRKFDLLPDILKKACKEPDFYIVWSTS